MVCPYGDMLSTQEPCHQWPPAIFVQNVQDRLIHRHKVH